MARVRSASAQVSVVQARLALLAAVALGVATSQPVVQLDAWGPDSVRVRIAPQGGAIVDNPYGPYVARAAGASTASSPVALTVGNLAVAADAATGFISATRVSDGVLLFSTTALVFGSPAPGSRAGSASASLVLNVTGGVANRLYGLGEHTTGRLDMTGYSKLVSDSQYYARSHGADILIPFYMAHPLGLGLLWAASSYGVVDLQPTAHNWTSFALLNVDFWITTTPAPPGVPQSHTSDPAASSPMAALLHNYVDAVGHATPMPPYVAGFWQCKNRYRNQTQVLDVARGYRDRGLPLDIITIDYMHWAEFGDWSFNPKCFPDPAAMVQELNDMGVELAVTFWPMVTPSGAYYNNFTSAGFFALNLTTGLPAPVESWSGPMYLTDETNAAARKAIYAAFRRGYGQFGIRTVWLDGSEPERSGADNFGQFRLAGGTDNEVGEAWILNHVQAMAEGFAADGYAPDEFFLLPRSAWSGTQRYSAGVWSGDINSDFATLAEQVVVAQGMGLSGHALWTNDGGGYGGGDPSDPVFQELIVRWLQASTFFSIMRLHGDRSGGPPADSCGETGGDNELWTLAVDSEHYDALVAAVQLRSDLRDYTLALNRVTVMTGLPMVRAMVLAFPGDAACASASVESQWMYGRDYLVKPVTQQGLAAVSVYLPDISASNHTWIYVHNGTDCGQGGVSVTIDTSAIAHFPLFLRTPTAPVPPPPGPLNVSTLWSASRSDVVTCASAACYSDQQPDGGYAPLFDEGGAWDAPGSVTIAGQSYVLTALADYWSSSLSDNAVSIGGAAPGPTYDVVIDNGFVLSKQAPGSAPLTLYLKTYSASHVDIAAFASAEGAAWAAANGYARTGSAGFVMVNASST